MTNALEVRDLSISVPSSSGKQLAVDGISFTIPAGKRIALVGESGSGKSLTAYSLMRLLKDPVHLESGEIWLNGRDITKLDQKDFQKVRGGEIGMVYQDPMSALNPLMRIGKQIVESIQIHSTMNKTEAKKSAIEFLEKVGIQSPEESFNSFPFEMSGGMLQRVVIAMALSGNPKVLIADEATTALDVTTQSRVLHLINGLAKERGLSVLLITHDLGVAAQFADEIVVMYAGRIVEYGEIRNTFSNPLHPYTRALLDSRCDYTMDHLQPIKTIVGQPPRPENRPSGCAFAPRCEFMKNSCEVSVPVLEVLEGSRVACFRAEELHQISRVR